MKKGQLELRKMVLTAMFMALGLVMPFLTMQIQEIGNKLLPMHLPVILCGFFCGAPYGMIAGLVVPLLRSILFGMPKLMPMAVSMAFELAAYGFFAGFFYRRFCRKKGGICLSLILSMLLGRVVWGVASFLLYRMVSESFGWQLFVAGAFVNAIPGILLQLVLIPLLVYQMRRLTQNEND